MSKIPEDVWARIEDAVFEIRDAPRNSERISPLLYRIRTEIEALLPDSALSDPETDTAWLKGFQQDLDTCPKCGGPADNGHDRCDPPSPYVCTRCTAIERLEARVAALEDWRKEVSTGSQKPRMTKEEFDKMYPLDNPMSYRGCDYNGDLDLWKTYRGSPAD